MRVFQVNVLPKVLVQGVMLAGDHLGHQKRVF
jgi:hypothetical protein